MALCLKHTRIRCGCSPVPDVQNHINHIKDTQIDLCKTTKRTLPCGVCSIKRASRRLDNLAIICTRPVDRCCVLRDGSPSHVQHNQLPLTLTTLQRKMIPECGPSPMRQPL